VDLYAALLRDGEVVEHALRPGRHAWVQLARGRCELGGVSLEVGDGAALSQESKLRLAGSDEAEALVFDLA
jgi:redox-sensitive bicupin YhaK (pirin superfamily)